MKTNTAGVELIKSYEKCRLKAYPDPGTGGDPWTIGWGHTGAEVCEGLTWTQEQADQAFVEDLAKFERIVASLVTTALTENQFSALVSLVYNTGSAPLHGHLGKYLALGNYQMAADQFLVWDHSGGKEMPGLLARREKERDLFSL